jgi:hypothetical protein
MEPESTQHDRNSARGSAEFGMVPTVYGSAAYPFARHWTGRARWDYYGYHEDSNGSGQDLFAPRNFRRNIVTLSVRYTL